MWFGRICVAFTWLLCVPAFSAVGAQSRYATRLREYRHGLREVALREGAELDEKRIRELTGDFLEGNPSVLDVKAAVVLHTELAHLRAPRSRSPSAHADAAERLLSRIQDLPEAASFTRTWLLLQSVVHQAASFDLDSLVSALEPLEKAEERWPTDPILHLALGAVFEKASDLSGRDEGFLETSIAHYRSALTSQPGLAEAHLRLGRVLSLLEHESHAEEAIDELEWVIRNTRTSDLHYLGHLFRGQLYARMGDDDAALRAYRSAVSASPSAQTAQIALSQSLRLEGRRDESYAVLSEALALPVFDASYADDYRLYRLGLVRWLPSLVSALRAEVMEASPP